MRRYLRETLLVLAPAVVTLALDDRFSWRISAERSATAIVFAAMLMPLIAGPLLTLRLQRLNTFLGSNRIGVVAWLAGCLWPAGLLHSMESGDDWPPALLPLLPPLVERGLGRWLIDRGELSILTVISGLPLLTAWLVVAVLIATLIALRRGRDRGPVAINAAAADVEERTPASSPP